MPSEDAKALRVGEHETPHYKKLIIFPWKVSTDVASIGKVPTDFWQVKEFGGTLTLLAKKIGEKRCATKWRELLTDVSLDTLLYLQNIGMESSMSVIHISYWRVAGDIHTSIIFIVEFKVWNLLLVLMDSTTQVSSVTSIYNLPTGLPSVTKSQI